MGRRGPHFENCMEWSIVGDGQFLPSMGSVKTLPPGCYKPIYNGNTWVLTYSEIQHDKIYDLDDSVQSSVMSEFEAFVNRRESYKRYGIVYKRGILLHGEPGTGKTVILAQIAEAIIKQGGYVLDIYGNISVARIGLDLIKAVHPDALVVVLMEDVDGYCDGDDDEEALLELMDGNSQHNAVVYLATTNHLESIPDRVRRRPSRFDAVLKVGAPSKRARKNYLLKLDRDMTAEEADQIALLTDGMVMSHIKEVFLLFRVYGHSIEESVKRVRAFCPEGKSEGE